MRVSFKSVSGTATTPEIANRRTTAASFLAMFLGISDKAGAAGESTHPDQMIKVDAESSGEDTTGDVTESEQNGTCEASVSSGALVDTRSTLPKPNAQTIQNLRPKQNASPTQSTQPACRRTERASGSAPGCDLPMPQPDSIVGFSDPASIGNGSASAKQVKTGDVSSAAVSRPGERFVNAQGDGTSNGQLVSLESRPDYQQAIEKAVSGDAPTSAPQSETYADCLQQLPVEAFQPQAVDGVKDSHSLGNSTPAQTTSPASQVRIGSSTPALGPSGNLGASSPVVVNTSGTQENNGQARGQQSGSQSQDHMTNAIPQALDAVIQSQAQTNPATLHIAAPLFIAEPASRHVPGNGAHEIPPQLGQMSEKLQADSSENSAFAGTPGINSAKLIQTMSQSEMRIGLHSADFGEISIRTSISRQQVQAQIAVEHSELGSTLSSHIPSLESKLGSEFGVRASVEVTGNGGSPANGHGQPSQQSHQAAPVPAADGVAQLVEADSVGFRAQVSRIEAGRLDIRA